MPELIEPFEFLLKLLKERRQEGKGLLTVKEKVVYEILRYLTKEGRNTYSFSWKEFAELTGITQERLRPLMQNLRDKGYINFAEKQSGRSRIILWMTDSREDFDTYFFDVRISLHARALLLLMYKTTEGRKRGMFFTGLYRKLFHNLKPTVMKVIKELERYGFCVGHLKGHAYIFERLRDLPFSYKDYPSPLEIGLNHSKLYGLYTTLFLISNADCTVFYPISVSTTRGSLSNTAKELIKLGFLERIDNYRSFKLKVIPEPYRGRFMKEAFI